jgi:hypothetical protein
VGEGVDGEEVEDEDTVTVTEEVTVPALLLAVSV